MFSYPSSSIFRPWPLRPALVVTAVMSGLFFSCVLLIAADFGAHQQLSHYQHAALVNGDSDEGGELLRYQPPKPEKLKVSDLR